MNNNWEYKRWLRDAEEEFAAMKKLPEDDCVRICRSAQLVIEFSCKSIISIFESIEWTHNPSEQLTKLVEIEKEKIIDKFGEEMVNDLIALAEDTNFASPWHGKSVYGEWISPYEHIAAVDVCTKENADDLSIRAERALKITKKFVNGWVDIK